ncbi:MAG: hypothetical protein ACXADW_19910 [Candidatus Hodarchaeales archaeon]
MSLKIVKDGECNPFKTKLPEDAKLIKKYGSWDFYFSNSEYALYVEMTDYHAGLLRLSEKQFFDLNKMIVSVMETAKEEIRKDIEKELEDIFENIMAKDNRRELFKEAKAKLFLPE